MRLSDIKNTEPKRAHGDISSLKESIKSVGLLNPLTIDENGHLLAGRRRYEAIKELGWEDAPVRVIPVNGDRLLAFRIAIQENLKRKDLTEVEEAIAIKEYDDLQRKLEGESKAGGDRQSIHQTLVNGWSQAKTAEELGVSQQTISRDIKIATAIEQYPDLAKEKQGQRVLAEYKRREAKPVELPAGQYRTIVVDPAWPVDKVFREARPNQYDPQYPLMTIEEIKSLPISSLTFNDGAHLYLWTTQRFLPIAFEVLGCWGFKYIFTMVWHKAGGFQMYGLPQYNCEFILFGRKGGLDFEERKDFPVCFEGERREHSRKPDRFYEIVGRVSPSPRLDMFTREKRDGFEQWGNEIDKF